MKSHLEETLLYQIRIAGLPTPTREFKAVIGRRFRWDFAFEHQKLLVEVQGGIWTKGKHSTGVGITRDAEKLNFATCAGWRCLCVTGDQIKSGQALRWIQKALRDAA